MFNNNTISFLAQFPSESSSDSEERILYKRAPKFSVQTIFQSCQLNSTFTVSLSIPSFMLGVSNLFIYIKIPDSSPTTPRMSRTRSSNLLPDSPSKNTRSSKSKDSDLPAVLVSPSKRRKILQSDKDQDVWDQSDAKIKGKKKFHLCIQYYLTNQCHSCGDGEMEITCIRPL